MEFNVKKGSFVDRPIKVIGVGGGGCNAVIHMHNLGIQGVQYVVMNTDRQALANCMIEEQVQMGPGEGAGANPAVGRKFSEDAIDGIKEAIGSNTKMCFITAGMGGGTGTGAAPVVARICRDMGILTVGIVTTPFMMEGPRRKKHAQEGINELREYVDTLVVISNDKVNELYGSAKISEAFASADDVLATAAKGIAEIITRPGKVNVDFQDVHTVMSNSGVAIMGSHRVAGENRAMEAVQGALNSPLLNDSDIRGAEYVLVNVSYGSKEAELREVSEITNYIQEEAGNNADVILGICEDDELGEELNVTVLATGFHSNQNAKLPITQKKVITDLNKETNVGPVIETTRPIVQNPVVPTAENQTTAPATADHLEMQIHKLNEAGDVRKNIQSTIDFEANKKVAEENALKAQQQKMQTPIQQSVRPVASDSDDEMIPLDDHAKSLIDRQRRLRSLKTKMSSQAGLNELEKKPAYQRHNVSLDQNTGNLERRISHSIVEKDERGNVIINKNRNVDPELD